VTEPFDVCGELPTGVTVLEASAGTGKTWTIAALAARYVAEGTPLEELLLVTFTRMATGELRDRVRERLVGTEQALSRVLIGEPPGDDPLVRLLASEHVRERRDNLSQALANFDAATVATIHGFCQEVLGGLGVAADVEGELVDDPTDLVNEVVDDLYVRRFLREDRPTITRDEAGRVATIAVENPVAPIEPRAAPENTVAAMRRRLAVAVRDELAVRKRRAGVLTYDDLLTELDSVLRSDRGEAVARRLRERWKVVLVDEFQDTDPIQWSIMRQAFATSTLVLIGDPKQAIYAFRGADVYAYLDAARTATTQATLDVNRRSDQGLIDAYDALFAGARLGHEGIVYRKVRAAREGRGIQDPPTPPLRMRIVRRGDVRSTARGYAELPSVREHVAKDVAADLVQLLSGGDVKPGDVAVLVQTNRNAARIRDALDAAGIPAVINGAGSVFGTVEAEQWLRLLEALERPTSELRARSAALTPFLGWSAERVAAAGDEDWEDVHRRLHDWARVLRLWGVASLVETITLAERLPERVLSGASGERRLTDLRHVGELLHAEQLGTTALAGWLRRRIAEAGHDTGDEDRSRRLESDAAAVQVLTVHRSKGLEFPVVYFPDLFEPGYIPERVPVTFHDADDVRTIDVGLTGADFNRHREQFVVEQRGEDLRIAYVALTRARHQAVVWWAPTFGSRDSSLGRLLFARAADGTIPAAGRSVPGDDEAWQRFERLAADAPGCIDVERSQLGLPLGWSGPPRERAELSAAAFDRDLDRHWRRTSFTDMTAAAHEVRVGSEPEETVLDDEPEGPAMPAAGDLPLAAMPAGVEVGTFVHRVLEATDFAAADLDAELATRIAEVQTRRAVEIGDTAAVVAGLRGAIETPLGPLLGGHGLRDVRREDRLDELDFELPLVGGDDPTGGLALDALVAPGLPQRLADPSLRRDVRGYLTGSIDLVVRAGDRFAVIDYKTNWLGAPGEPLTARHYRPAALAAEMERSHYGLQALLYLVALHRYLRWRLPGYDPDRSLAGVGYLFLRGMTGGEGGVFAWHPPGSVVEALSDVLDRGR
jgi:exodeoxyribonuclease V beta subunit